MLLVRQADAAVVEREVQLLAARIVDAQRDVAVEFVFLGLGVRQCHHPIGANSSAARRPGNRCRRTWRCHPARSSSSRLAGRVRSASDELGPGGEGQRLGGHDAGAQAGEWRRADAHDDLLDIGRSQAGLLDRARDIDLLFHMVRESVSQWAAPHNADRRAE